MSTSIVRHDYEVHVVEDGNEGEHFVEVSDWGDESCCIVR